MEVVICVLELFHSSLHALRLAIIQDDYPESILWVVYIAGRANRIQDQIIVLAATCDEDVHRWNIFSYQPQFGPVSLLQYEDRPE